MDTDVHDEGPRRLVETTMTWTVTAKLASHEPPEGPIRHRLQGVLTGTLAGVLEHASYRATTVVEEVLGDLDAVVDLDIDEVTRYGDTLERLYDQFRRGLWTVEEYAGRVAAHAVEHA